MTRPGWPLWLYAAVAGVVVAASVIGWAGSALAWQPRMSLEPGDGDCFAQVRIINLMGMYNKTETLETELGPVSIRYETVGQHGPGDDDRIEVVALPEGVFARPMGAQIVDGQSLAVCLFEWSGL